MKQGDATILIAEDDETLREVIVFEFERNGFKVLAAPNGTEALRIVKTAKVDLVISDIRMPGGDGIQLLQELRKIHPDIPIFIFVSGFSDVLAKDALAMGARKVFTKPFDSAELIAEVLKALVEVKKGL